MQAGEVCKAMLFIEKGMLRQFYYKYDKDLTEHIGYENGMIICIESYFKQEPTRLMVETLEASVVWELPRVEVEKLIDQYHDIERLYRGFIEHSLIESQVKADTLRFEPAHERYNRLLNLSSHFKANMEVSYYYRHTHYSYHEDIKYKTFETRLGLIYQF